MNKPIKLIVSIIIAELAGIIGSIFTAPQISGWYQTLAKPSIAPPNWIFAPVWTVLFALMGIALFLIWSSKDQNLTPTKKNTIKIALYLFAGQLILNILWSMIFFGIQSPEWAFIEIIFLWLAILATIIAFNKISRPAAYLLLPYILWVSFAAYLNFTIQSLN